MSVPLSLNYEKATLLPIFVIIHRTTKHAVIRILTTPRLLQKNVTRKALYILSLPSHDMCTRIKSRKGRKPNNGNILILKMKSSHLQHGIHDVLHGGEVGVPQELGLLAHAHDPLVAQVAHEVGDLEESALVRPDDGGLPVDNFGKRKHPVVGEHDGNTASLKSLQEAVGPESAAARHETKG